MRTKQEILDDLRGHAYRLDDSQHELAAITMIETEVQIDIRDELTALITILGSVEKIAYRPGQIPG